MSRYGNNIRRIAQTDELSGRVLQAEQRLNVLDKAGIPGGRAITYPGGGGVQTGSPGTTNPDKNGSPDQNDTTKKGPMDTAGKDDNTTDGDSILNGTKVLQKDEDPGALALKDCDSGELIDVRLNTGANPSESKFKHPEGWGVAGPQNDPSYTSGRVWKIISGATSLYSNNFDDIIAARSALDGTTSYGVGPAPTYVIQSTPASYGSTIIQFSTAGQTIGNPVSGGTQYLLQAYAAGVAIPNGRVGQQDCGLTVDSNVACAADPPPQYSNWQEQDPDYKHQLVFSAQDGGFVSSSYDDGLPAKFRNNVGGGKGLNNVKLCTADGNEVVVSALSDGTFAYFEEDGFGMPQEDAKIFHFSKEGKYQDLLRPDEYGHLRSTNNPAA